MARTASDSGNVNIDSLAWVTPGSPYPAPPQLTVEDCRFGTVCQAESGTRGGSATVATDHNDYSGSGFVAGLQPARATPCTSSTSHARAAMRCSGRRQNPNDSHVASVTGVARVTTPDRARRGHAGGCEARLVVLELADIQVTPGAESDFANAYRGIKNVVTSTRGCHWGQDRFHGRVLGKMSMQSLGCPTRVRVPDAREQRGMANRHMSGRIVIGALAVMVVTACSASSTGGKATSSSTAPPSTGRARLSPGTSWQWQIDGGTINESVLDGVANPKKMYDVDMEATPAATIARLRAKRITVVCYLETGSWENYRSDAAAFPASVKGSTMGGYPNERYLDIRQIKVLRPIMDARLDRAKAKGCDGIEPDIDDSWQESTGFPLTLANQVAYNAQLIADAHARGMSMGQKNGPVAAFTTAMLRAGADWALNEQCNQYSQCASYQAYTTAGKAVFQVEYSAEGETVAKFCPADNAAKFDGLLKKSSDTLAALPRTACRLG